MRSVITVRLPRWLSGAGMVMLAVPFVAIVGLALTRPWSPSTDLALMQLRTLDVGGPATPLLGPYSRFGWYHPGPLAYWILAVPYRLAGARPVGLLVGTAAVHGAAVTGCLVLAHRRGGRALGAVVALTLAMLIGGFGARALVDFWNPYLPLFALVFLVLATWSVMEGDIGLLPVVVAVSSFAWQSHLSYLAVTGLLVAVSVSAGGWIALRRIRRAGADRRRAVLVLAATLVTAAVCLAPVVVEEGTNRPGNIGLIVASLRDPPRPIVGLDRAAAIVADQFSPAGPWLRGGDRDERDGQEGTRAGEAGLLLLVVPFAALLGVALMARRVGAHAAVRLMALTGACAVVSMLSVSRMIGEPFTYLLAWLRPVAMVVWMSVAWGLVCVARARARDRLVGAPVRMATAVLVAGATAVVVVGSVAADRSVVLPRDRQSAPLQVLGPAAVGAAAGQPAVRLAMSGGWCAGELGTGIGAQLEANGTAVVVPEDSALPFGRQRGGAGTRPAVELVCGAGTTEHIAHSPVTPVATAGLLTGNELAELRGLQDTLRAGLQAQGRGDLADVVENQAFLTVADLARSGLPLDPGQVARFTELMDRSRYSGAVYYRPDGLAD